MNYDDIFTKPISECTDDEIRNRALELRSKAKLTRGKPKTSKQLTKKKTITPKGKTSKMLEEAMNNARKQNERNNKKEKQNETDSSD